MATVREQDLSRQQQSDLFTLRLVYVRLPQIVRESEVILRTMSPIGVPQTAVRVDWLEFAQKHERSLSEVVDLYHDLSDASQDEDEQDRIYILFKQAERRLRAKINAHFKEG